MTHVDVNELLSYGIKQDLEKNSFNRLSTHGNVAFIDLFCLC